MIANCDADIQWKLVFTTNYKYITMVITQYETLFSEAEISGLKQRTEKQSCTEAYYQEIQESEDIPCTFILSRISFTNNHLSLNTVGANHRKI